MNQNLFMIKILNSLTLILLKKMKGIEVYLELLFFALSTLKISQKEKELRPLKRWWHILLRNTPISTLIVKISMLNNKENLSLMNFKKIVLSNLILIRSFMKKLVIVKWPKSSLKNLEKKA